MFLCHKTEYPDELSFQKKKTYQQVNAICNNGIELTIIMRSTQFNV